MLPSLEAATSEVPAPISHIAMLMSLNSFGTTAFIAAIGSRVSPAVSRPASSTAAQRLSTTYAGRNAAMTSVTSSLPLCPSGFETL